MCQSFRVELLTHAVCHLPVKAVARRPPRRSDCVFLPFHFLYRYLYLFSLCLIFFSQIFVFSGSFFYNITIYFGWPFDSILPSTATGGICLHSRLTSPCRNHRPRSQVVGSFTLSPETRPTPHSGKRRYRFNTRPPSQVVLAVKLPAV